MAKKRKGLLKGISGNLKRKARNSAKQTLYMMMWKEEVPSKYKRS